MQKTIYLANSYGFSPSLKATALQDIREALEGLGYQVREPFVSAVLRGRLQEIAAQTPDWQSRISQDCLDDVRACDCVLAVVNGCPPDDGVAIEVGYAFALCKPVFLFRDDLRRCGDSDDYPLNLMFLGGLSVAVGSQFLYRSLRDLVDPARPLAMFAYIGG